MVLFATKYIMVIAESWFQDTYSALCLPILGTTLTSYQTESNDTVFNLIIPILFFDFIILWSTKSTIDNQ